MDVDLKKRLELYLPSLFELIVGDFGWNKLNKSFNKNFEKYKKRYVTEKKSLLKRNIYSTISGAICGNKFDLALHFYLDNLFKNLSLNLDRDAKIWIKKNLRDLLLWEGFIETLGELSVLDNLMDTKNYKLIETEAVKDSRSKEGKKRTCIDFKLKLIDNKKDILIEVVNIELKDTNAFSNEAIEKLLTYKLKKKVVEKNKSGLDYKLIPVLYYEKIDLLKKVSKFYEESNFKINNIETPRAFAWFDEGLNKVETRFGSIHTVIKPKILERV